MDNYRPNLEKVHLEDLKKSGLTDETIREARFETVPPDQIRKIMGPKSEGVSSVYKIPFPNGLYSRYKIFYESGKELNENGKPRRKYHTKKGSGNKLYIPPRARIILNDNSILLDITEGEKKALKACQEGLDCIAITGLWNWKVDGEELLIEDFGQINLKGRTIIITPDSHWLAPNTKGERKNLKPAVKRFADLLIDKGAKVFWRELPVGEIEVKLDDFLCYHTLEELRKLTVHPIRKSTLNEMLDKATPDIEPYEKQEILKRIAGCTSETDRSQYINKFHEKTKISKSAIIKSVKLENNEDVNNKFILNANFPGLIDVVIDDCNNTENTTYFIKNNNNILFISKWEISDGKFFVPPGKSLFPSELPRATKVKEWYEADNDTQLFKDLKAYFQQFSYLPDELWSIIVCTVFLSYVQDHDDIYYLPMLLFWAVPERGKSKTGKAMAYVSYRGIHLVELREANLFRYSQDMKATLFLDIMNLWKKAEANKVEDILLLRYEKGAKASRVLYPEKGSFMDMQHYDIYGPTILATNESVHKILDTRCIPISMPNKPGRYENPKPEKAQELKERLTAWRARVIDKPLPGIDDINGLSGRMFDISRPVLQVCKSVYPEGFNALSKTLLRLAKEKTEDKSAGIEGQIITALHTYSPKEEENVPEWSIWIAKILELLNESRPDEHKLTPQYLGRKLKAIGIKTRKKQGYSEVLINKTEFDTLLIQYGILDTQSIEKTLPLSTTPISQETTNTYVGRELKESHGGAFNSLPTQPIENKELKRVVES